MTKEPIKMSDKEIWNNRYCLAHRVSFIRSIYKESDLERFYPILSSGQLLDMLNQLNDYNKDYENQKKILSIKEELFKREKFLTAIVFEEKIEENFHCDAYQTIDYLNICVKKHLEKSRNFILNNCNFLVTRCCKKSINLLFDNLQHISRKRAKEIVKDLTDSPVVHDIAAALMDKPEFLKLFVSCGYDIQALVNDTYYSSKLLNPYSMDIKKIEWLENTFGLDLEKFINDNKVLSLMIERNAPEEHIIDLIKRYPNCMNKWCKASVQNDFIKVDNFINYSPYLFSVIHKKHRVSNYLKDINTLGLMAYGHSELKEINELESLISSWGTPIHVALKLLQDKKAEVEGWVINYLNSGSYRNYSGLMSDIQELVCYYIENAENFKIEDLKKIYYYDRLDKNIIEACMQRREISKNIRNKKMGKINKI